MKTKLILLTQGQSAIVSKEDYEYLMQWKWYAQRIPRTYGHYWQVVRAERNPNHWPRQRKVFMSREVARLTGLQESPKYDHKDTNGLNNTRENIRPCDTSQNGSNRVKQTGTASVYKGVDWHKSQDKWRARIMIHGKRIELGHFNDELEAHQVYAVAARKHFGEFARP